MTEKHSKKLLLIDAMALAFRAFYSMPPTMTLPDGQPINAVYGFTNMLFLAIDKIKPDYLCVCFDVKGPTFRHERFPDYKGHRPPPPEDFVPQIPMIKSILNDMAFPCIEKQGYEADDLMGTLSVLATQEGLDTVIMTGDQDTLQLVNDHVKILLNKKGISDMRLMDEAAILEKHQLTPAQIIDYKALKGDASDNIPGVKGIGDKTATTLLLNYKTLDGIYANTDTLKGAVKTKIESGKDMAYLSYELATIKVDVPIEKSFDEMNFAPQWPQILAAFKTYNFNSLIRRYEAKLSKASEEERSEVGLNAPDGDYTCVENDKVLAQFLNDAKNGIAIDLETTSLHIKDAQIVGVALAKQAKEAIYIPLNDAVTPEVSQEALFSFGETEEVAAKDRFQMHPLLAQLKPILEDENIPKYTHNGKYEFSVLKNYGITLNGIKNDSLLAAYLLYPGERLGLKELVNNIYSIQMTTYEDVAGKGVKAKRFDEIDIDTATQYAAADADFTWRLCETLTPELTQKSLDTLLNDIEIPSMITLAKMEGHGVSIDRSYLAQIETDFEKELVLLKEKIIDEAGCDFNINSPKQLAEILFDTLNLPVIKKTKTGRSTDASVLEKLQAAHPIAEYLLRFRTLEKLQNTYIKALPKLVHPVTEKIHTSFNQSVAATGRLSSTTPNLQNIPIKTKEGGKIRRAFIPQSKDRWILSADYSQIELRVLAHLAQDPNMLTAFQNGEDIHQKTAALVFDVPSESVSKEQRYRAKAVNFGIIYGQSAFGLSETLSIPRKEAQEIIDAYYARFPTIKNLMTSTVEETREKGYVTTILGRRRPVNEINSKNYQRRQFAERIAVNTRMQGSAADIIKVAMINIQKRLEAEALDSKMIIQVHDELVFDVSDAEKERLRQLVIDEMSSAARLSVPLSIDAVIGKNWEEIS